jgi:IS30 family transposase
LTPEVRREVIRLSLKGVSYREIVERLNVSTGLVGRVLVPLGGVVRSDELTGNARNLSLAERVEIRMGVEERLSGRTIAARLGRAGSTVCRELDANGGRAGYQPVVAHRRALEAARRPKATKLGANPLLCARVRAELERLWSPEQISAGLAADFGDDTTMQISPETIYKSLYVQGRGELRRELAACLRTGRAARRHRGRLETRGRISDMVLISQRPPEVDDRAVPGHWEGDVIVGKDGKSVVGTLVERQTRFVMLLHLKNKTAATVREAMTAKIIALPAQLRRSVTWDQGREMAEHVTFSVETGVPVYFCDPHSPWQRGTNENTNGLLRQYLPKGTDLSVHTPDDLDRIAESLNTRPRKTLGWMTPSAALAKLVATTG